MLAQAPTTPGLLTSVITNDASTGTTNAKLAKLTSSGKAILAAIADTDGMIGVVLSGAGTSGSAQIATNGVVACAFDGTATAGDYVQISTVTAGDCKDTGASTRPTSGQVIGRVVTGGVGAGNYTLALQIGVAYPSAGSNSTQGLLQGDGSTLTITGGTIKCTTATTSQLGCIEPDGTTITISSGVISGAAATLTEAQGRLTLTANTPVMTTTASAQTTLRYDCYTGGNVPYYTGSADAIDKISSCEVTDAMVSTASAGQVVSGNVYDVWWVHSGANRICLAMSSSSGGGGGWSADSGGSNTARGTGYTQLDRVTRPYTTNKNAISNCFNGSTNYGSVSANQGTYLGTVYASANGQISWILGGAASGGISALLGVWNMYNRVSVTTNVEDTGASYTYTTGTVRQARASAGNQIQILMGLPEDGVLVSYNGRTSTVSTTNAAAQFAIGPLNNNAGTLTNGCYSQYVGTNAASLGSACTDAYAFQSVIGFNTIYATEAGDGVNANTFNVASRNTLSATLRQ